MSEKIKGIHGSRTRFDEVKQWLINHGAKNFAGCKCCDPNEVYYLYPNGDVTSIHKSEEFLFDIEELPRWRARQGESYYFITSEGLISAAIEDGSFDSSMRYNAGNYFQTDENAVPYREKFIKLFRRNRWK